jgi:hypothetical protein
VDSVVDQLAAVLLVVDSAADQTVVADQAAKHFAEKNAVVKKKMD